MVEHSLGCVSLFVFIIIYFDKVKVVVYTVNFKWYIGSVTAMGRGTTGGQLFFQFYSGSFSKAWLVFCM